MGLKTLLGNSVQAAFKVLGSSTADGLQEAVTYHRVTSIGAYSAATRTTATVVTDILFDAVMYSVRDREIDGIKIRVDDARLIFPQSVLSVEPNATDSLTVRGEKWEIVNVSSDPASATWTLFIRGV
jgi:hypothetical protein